MPSKTIIGYSAWGFLGSGIVKTPDGGRSFRLPLLEALIQHHVEVVMLQRNRDLLETGIDFTRPGLYFDAVSYPKIDALLLEYRWPIPGINSAISPSHPKYTPDWDRQNQLLDYYSQIRIPILIWDQDQQMSIEEQEKWGNRAVIFESAFRPKAGRHSLFFPVDAKKTKAAVELLRYYNSSRRTVKLIYIGNQYDRNESFRKFYDIPSKNLIPPAQIYGRWDVSGKRTGITFSHVCFRGRAAFDQLSQLYSTALSTVLIAPERCYRNGHYTLRLFESLWGHCVPLVPASYAYREMLFPETLVVTHSDDVLTKIDWLQNVSNKDITGMLNEMLARIQQFSVEKQIETIMQYVQ